MTLDSSFTVTFANAKCFLCDCGFDEGEDTFLIFESRLRDDGEVDTPLSTVLSTALGRELEEKNSHSALLCDSCNKDVLEFEKMLQRFCEMRYQIITSYNSTAQRYNVAPIAIEIDGVLQDDDSNAADLKEAAETAKLEEDDNLEVQEAKVLPIKSECAEILPESTIFPCDTEALILEASGADLVEEVQDDESILVEENDAKNYTFAVMNINNQETELVLPEYITADKNEINVSSLQVDGQDIIIYGDMEENLSVHSAQDVNSNSNQTTSMLYPIDESDAETALSLGNDTPGHVLFEQQGDMYLCLLCTEHKSVNDKAFAEHMLSVHDLSFYNCDVCHAGFLSEENLREHKEQEQHTNSGNSSADLCMKIECDICQRVFTTYRLLRIHKRTHDSSSKNFECTECHKKYSCRNLLLDHMNMHTGKRPYKCNKCPKDFASKYTLQAHMRIHNERSRPFKCDECDKAFLNQQTYTHHKKLHVNVKSFMCEVCAKAFGTQHNLDVHKIVHSGERPFICRTCGKAFARRAEIKDHERIHTGEKPYKCDMCDAAFAQRSNLMTHRKTTHLNEKLHKCDQCGRSFKRRRLLEYHINAAHTGVRPHECDICGATFVYPEHKKKHMLIHANRKPYTCEVCGREFNSRDNRNAHRFVHSNKKPYECLECGAGFMRKPLLLAHMKHTGHASDTIIVNQPQISTNGMLSLTREVNIIENSEDKNDVITTSTADDESLENMMQQTEIIMNADDEEDDVKYLQFADLDKDGQQILTWVDIGDNKV